MATVFAPAVQPPHSSRILGLGGARPDHAVSSGQLGRPFGKDADWIQTRTGIRSLDRIHGENRHTALTELAERAASSALRAAHLDATQVDLVITASCSTERELADAARRTAPAAGWMQLNAACSGFCYALQTGDNLIRTGAATHVLIIAAEHMSRLLDPDDLGTTIIFGDGAGAAVLGPAGEQSPGIGPAVTGSDGARSELIAMSGGVLQMAGREVFRWAVEQVPAIARRACERAGIRLADVDVFVPHQANLRIIDAVVRALHLQHAVIADDITTSGNTSAASIPLALTRLLDTGQARTGDLALLAGFGAGLSYAAQVVVLP